MGYIDADNWINCPTHGIAKNTTICPGCYAVGLDKLRKRIEHMRSGAQSVIDYPGMEQENITRSEGAVSAYNLVLKAIEETK